jgi:hypothetical protein
MVDAAAPRLFAVVYELDDRADGHVAAWGMAFADRADVVHSDGGSWLSVSSPDRACRLLGHGPDVTARLVWVTRPTPE